MRLRTSQHACSHNRVVIGVIKATDLLGMCPQKNIEAGLARAYVLDKSHSLAVTIPLHVLEVLESLLEGSCKDLPHKRLAVDDFADGILHYDHKSLGQKSAPAPNLSIREVLPVTNASGCLRIW
jgi:hypothetical protein